MTWTTTRPTAPGWYWCQAPYSRPDCVCVWDSGGVLLFRRPDWRHDHPVTSYPNFRWAGPIPEPTEGQKGCPVEGHHPTCDCGGAGGDR